MDEYKKEYLGSGITAFVSNEHTFGTDALLLADFAAPKSNDKCCDLGTGCGIIPLLWCKKRTGSLTAVEISENAVKQFKTALIFNGLESRAEALCCDLRNLKGKAVFSSYNLVTMNPPYTAVGSGIISSSDCDKIARHGTMCTLDDVCKCSAELLTFGGRLCMCIRPERICELFSAMQKYKIEPKRMRLVSKRIGFRPWLVLIEGKKGGKSGMVVEPELFIYKDGNEYSDETKKIYADYLGETGGE